MCVPISQFHVLYSLAYTHRLSMHVATLGGIAKKNTFNTWVSISWYRWCDRFMLCAHCTCSSILVNQTSLWNTWILLFSAQKRMFCLCVMRTQIVPISLKHRVNIGSDTTPLNCGLWHKIHENPTNMPQIRFKYNYMVTALLVRVSFRSMLRFNSKSSYLPTKCRDRCLKIVFVLSHYLPLDRS